MDFEPRSAQPEEFADSHDRLSRSPDSKFVKVVMAQRRTPTGVDALRGCELTHRTSAGTSTHEVTSERQLREVLADRFGLTLQDVPTRDAHALWQRVRRDHLAWAQRPS